MDQSTTTTVPAVTISDESKESHDTVVSSDIPKNVPSTDLPSSCQSLTLNGLTYHYYSLPGYYVNDSIVYSGKTYVINMKEGGMNRYYQPCSFKFHSVKHKGVIYEFPIHDTLTLVPLQKTIATVWFSCFLS